MHSREHRFDTLARTVARQTSRRRVLLGVVTALAAVLSSARDDAAAHHTRIPLGGACRFTNQCLHHAVTTRRRRRQNRQAVYCADNGFAYDGPLNCCHNAGGHCTRDEHCCGARNLCRNKTCTQLLR